MLRERLAQLAHEQWSGWMEYLFSKGIFNEDGTWTMPAWAVERWTRQMKMPYSQLPDDEQESDRQEADKFLEVFKKSEIFESQFSLSHYPRHDHINRPID